VEYYVNSFPHIGEPSKANGFDLPPVISESLIEAVKKESHGYTVASGNLEARKAIADK
jgi:aspartate/methionine/tyrosine aminotransferase